MPPLWGSSKIASPIVSSIWLAENLERDDLRLIDMRWYLDGRSGHEAYLHGHIPGAVFLELDDITGQGLGRHPLPSAAQFAGAMSRAGVSQSSLVVVYDDAGGSVAGRLWWLLGRFGETRVKVLDGGLQSWTGPLEMGGGKTEAADFPSREANWDSVALMEEVAAPGPVTLLDARAPERFRGEVEPIDPHAGHIPGAKNFFWQETLGADGRFLSPEQLRATFESYGVTGDEQVICYCGSGVTSCQLLLAASIADIGLPRLYAGSWSEWCARDGAVATGP
ncbi:MAG TPA: sulfurtransferase [Candidatus Dormibacteraeota bacterium]|nr:sulfurtransferase [Candidatus Dormibacteraeota bacterium]